MSFFAWSVAIASFAVSPTAFGESITHSKTFLGKRLSVQQNHQSTMSHQGLSTQTQVEIFGKKRNLIDAQIEAENKPSNLPQVRTELYVRGIRIWDGNLRVEQGGLVYSGGVAPTQVPIPLVTYPIGPLILQLDAGIEFEGMAEAKVLPGISYPIEDMSIDAKLQTDLYVAGYVEGYAKLLFVRGGMGGRLNLIDGQTGVGGTITFNGMPMQTYGYGKVSLLSGQVYAFVDSKFLFGSWTRWYSKNIYRYAGKCYSFGDAACGFH